MFIEFCPGGAIDDVISGVCVRVCVCVCVCILCVEVVDIVTVLSLELEKGLNETQIKCVTHQLFTVNIIIYTVYILVYNYIYTVYNTTCVYSIYSNS